MQWQFSLLSALLLQSLPDPDAAAESWPAAAPTACVNRAGRRELNAIVVCRSPAGCTTGCLLLLTFFPPSITLRSNV